MLQVEQYNIIARNNLEGTWAILLLITQIFVYYFMLSHILKPKRIDVIPSVFFIYQHFCLLLLSMNLAFNGRYENFEIYGFIILAIFIFMVIFYSIWKLNFGKFEKALS